MQRDAFWKDRSLLTIFIIWIGCPTTWHIGYIRLLKSMANLGGIQLASLDYLRVFYVVEADPELMPQLKKMNRRCFCFKIMKMTITSMVLIGFDWFCGLDLDMDIWHSPQYSVGVYGCRSYESVYNTCWSFHLNSRECSSIQRLVYGCGYGSIAFAI